MLPEGGYDPRTWWKPGTWAVGSRSAALARTPGFGQRFFAETAKRFSSIDSQAVFLRWTMQPDDVYAVFTVGEGGIGVQIDPDLEYVIVWGGRGAAGEFGHWDGDPVAQAIEFMSDLIRAGTPQS